MKHGHDLIGLLEIFNFTLDDLPKKTNNIPKMEKELVEFKKRLKNRYRKLAMKYHPDHGGSKEKFVLLGNAYSELKKLKVFVRSPAPVINTAFFHRMSFNFQTCSNSNYSTSANYTVWTS